jgi:exonuclease SbcD
LKIIHTSDWHIGRTLYGRRRYEEFSQFLDWLYQFIVTEKIDALIIAGDIFDTSTPSNRAQELYYRFLSRVCASECRYVVVTAGNHDSPTFLDAPKQLLEAMNVFVITSPTEDPEDEVLVLKDKDGNPGVIICAVPYLRDRDLRTFEPGEDIDEKNTKLTEGIKSHYDQVCSIAELKRNSIGMPQIPILATGHLFASGGKTIEGDGVRELYVGSLSHISVDIFPESIDYLALGHLHVPQRVGGSEMMRYSGSPIPMGFGESTQTKQINILETGNGPISVISHPVPCFQQLVTISGTIDQIQDRIEELRREERSAWLEIEYTGAELVPNLKELLEQEVQETDMEIRRIRNRRVMEQVLKAAEHQETLDDLNYDEVFMRCLDSHEIPIDDRDDLISSYHEIMKSIHEEDVNEQ